MKKMKRIKNNFQDFIIIINKKKLKKFLWWKDNKEDNKES